MIEDEYSVEQADATRRDLEQLGQAFHAATWAPASKRTSQIRTGVPMVVGALVAIAADRGVELSAAEVAGLNTVAGFVYYVVVRWLETSGSARWGWLLGAAKAPVYAGT